MPDDRSKSRKPSRQRKLIPSVRARLVVLALVCIAPLMFERVQALETTRARHIERARAEAVALARRGAEAQRQTVSSVRPLLELLAHTYATMPVEPAS